VPGLLADVNVEGHFHAIVSPFQAAPWNGIWTDMDVSLQTFASVGLPRNVSDADLWRTCQQRDLILVTGNRNREGADSLEATIRANNTLTSLPVLTLASPKRILIDRAYAERVAERILDYLVDIERYRGTGRLFVP
jgi:hypothetical protein